MPQARLCGCWGGRVLPLLLAYVCYLLLGAAVFQLLEKQAEAQSRDQVQFEKLRFLENYTCLDQRALEQFVQVIMEAWVKGVNPKGNSTNPSNWDFGSSFFFAGTVVTTIGYGNLAPSTEAGQVFCVFYALVGIPLNVVFLNHLGAGLHGHLATLERWEEQPRRSQLLQILGLALFLTLGTLVILIFPPMVFSHVEGWSFGEGFYFAFITLSTIGFGDYVVGTDPSKHYISVYRSLAAIWILLGLAWLALILPLGPLLLHRCSQLWPLRLRQGCEEEEAPDGTHREGSTATRVTQVTPQDFLGIIQAYQSGDIVLGNTTSMGRWEFMGSFFFSVSTVTTIGYGNLSPRTMAARLFCIFFALVGIPLNLVVLNRLGHLMQRGMHRCARRLGGAWQDPTKARWLAGAGALFSGLLLFLLLPPLLFCHMEGWSYVESFYFAFITLSTVGFGDYVIGMDPSRRYPLWYKNTVSLWILFGMAWLALIIKLILSLLETPGRSYSCYHHSSKENFKSQSWRQNPDGEAEPHSPQPGCHPEEPMGIMQHPEPSTQVSCCGKDN
uniref:potassium channel subfamily K member 17 isoform X1 n=1 Tax=Halichoerus grypus TaxID=9711 RepID=UPI0016592C69|nr:potassium channel subfamily K member 17 isoform X1 [Halichoerus grypus]